MKIEILHKHQVDENVKMQIQNLFNQLNSNIVQLSLEELIDGGNKLILAICKNEENIIGMATLVTYKAISGHKGMIEDVVVVESQRGKGIGRKLMEKLIEEGEKRQLTEILLFSGHHRQAAINLYQSLGFTLKNSGLYRLQFE